MKIISYAIFGNNENYWKYFPAMIRANLFLYKNWQIKIYHSNTINNCYYGKTLLAMADAGMISLKNMGEDDLHCKSMLWRMQPMWENDVECFLCRDIDALPTGRERATVEAFLELKVACHCINDNTAHTVPMLGGMIGFRPDLAKNRIKIDSFEQFKELYNSYSDDMWNTKGTDQTLLQEKIWDRIKCDTCAHRLKYVFNDYSIDNGIKYLYKSIDTNRFARNIKISKEILDETNKCVPFIGVDGYDIPSVIGFYDTLLDKDILEKIRKLEN